MIRLAFIIGVCMAGRLGPNSNYRPDLRCCGDESLRIFLPQIVCRKTPNKRSAEKTATSVGHTPLPA